VTDDLDPPAPLTVIRVFLGTATAVAVVAFMVQLVRDHTYNWALLGFVGLVGIWSDLFRMILRPLGAVFDRLMWGGAITIEDEIASLEELMRRPQDPADEILHGIRLAEIYRTHQRSPAKAAALLDRLAAKYPHAPELEIARRFP